MTPERWRQAEELCEAALKLPPTERSAFLAKSCGNDASLRQHVEALLEGHEQAGDFLARPALEVAAQAMASKPSGLLAGQRLSHYTISSLLGSGGMGEVYRAHDDQLQRDVAIKVLMETSVADASARSRLLREARSAAALNHPHVCTIYEVGEADGMAYITMELIEGEPLNKVIPAGGLLVEQVVRYGLQIADAVGHAHEKGVIHRDLKTANILVANQRHAKVLDFGLAKRVNRDQLSEAASVKSATYVTETGTLVGTLPYMAPEQFRGRGADARTDVWAIGVILYEMATGKRPFEGQTVFELSSSVLTHEPRFPDSPPPSLAPLIPVIQRCLRKEPGERYAKGNEVHAALEQVQTTQIPLPAPSISRDTTRRRLPFIVFPISAVALVLLGAWLFRRSGDASSDPIPVGTARVFTNYDGWEIAPSWSPDGSRIAYTRVGVSSADIAVQSPGGEPQILTADSAADEFQPSFSPSGTKIAFLSDRGAGTNIYWIPASGGAEHKVAETHIPFLQRMGAWAAALGSNAWSKDETQVVFARLQPNGDVALWTANIATGEPKPLTSPPPGGEDRYAAWSSDGKTIAFTRTVAGFSSIWTVPADGGQPTRLLMEGQYGAMPAWLPDSRRLLYMGSELFEIELGAGKPSRQLTAGARDMISPAVSSDGRIAYSTYDHQVDVFWADLDEPRRDDTQDTRITAFTGEHFSPRVSPADDTKVLYASNRSGNYELYLFDRKTKKDEPLTNDPADDRLADWSPDGKEIVFMSSRGSELRLWVLQLQSEKPPRQLIAQVLPGTSHMAEAEGGPRWSPDRKLIAYLAPTDKGSAIWVVEPDGSNPHPTNILGATSFSWYRDSQRLIYARHAIDGSGHQELRAAHLGTGQDIPLRTGAIAEVAVSSDGRQLSFINAVSHFTMNLFAVGLTPANPNQLPRLAGQPRQITFGKGWHVHAGGWSPDGKAVVYSRDRDFGDIYIIDKKK